MLHSDSYRDGGMNNPLLLISLVLGAGFVVCLFIFILDAFMSCPYADTDTRKMIHVLCAMGSFWTFVNGMAVL